MEEEAGKQEVRKPAVSDYLANERTFLAWVRTSIALMGFGFVIVKFSLFLREISIALGRERIVQPKGYSAVIGVTMVALGCIVAVLAFLRYKSIERFLQRNKSISGNWLSALITLSIVKRPGQAGKK